MESLWTFVKEPESAINQVGESDAGNAKILRIVAATRKIK
jgi:hypothetical protein